MQPPLPRAINCIFDSDVSASLPRRGTLLKFSAMQRPSAYAYGIFLTGTYGLRPTSELKARLFLKVLGHWPTGQVHPGQVPLPAPILNVL